MENRHQEKMLDSLSVLLERGQDLASTSDIDQLLSKVMEVTEEICESEASSILLKEKDQPELHFKVVSGEKAEDVKKYKVSIDSGIAGWVATHGVPEIVNDAEADPRHFHIIDEELNFTTRSVAASPILWKENVIGVIEAINKKNNGMFDQHDLDYLNIIANQAAVALNISHEMDKLQNFFSHMMELLVLAIESISSTSQGHSVKVARMATEIAREMEIKEKEYKNIYYGALIHDIGKVRIERERMKGGLKIHPSIGAEMIRPIIMLKDVAPIIEFHHERWDGNGFPRGLKGDEIPLGARIVGLAESYVEWKEHVSFKRQVDPGFTENFFEKSEGAFDPECVNALKKVLGKQMYSREREF